MDWLDHIPALLRIAGVLAAILLLMRRRMPLGLALLIGGGLLSVLFPIPPGAALGAVGRAVWSADTGFLMVLVLGILLLSNAMRASGQLDRLIASFRDLVGQSRLMLVAFPAMIGLLPMPGGAVFSAPMVGEVSRGADITPHRKTLINYWFRHIWEHWFPLYPGVIVALALTGVDQAGFILMSLPMTGVSLLMGYVVLLRSVRLTGERRLNVTPARMGRFAYEMTPIFLMVLALMLLGTLVGRAPEAMHARWPILERLPILAGLALSMGWVIGKNRMTPAAVGSLLRQKGLWSMAGMVLGLVCFKQVLEECGAVGALKEELVAWHIPLIALVALIPLIAGAVVGIAVGFVGVSFPIVLSLLEQAGIGGPALLPYVFLAYSFGYVGMMWSPVHMCLLLTRDHFEADLGRVYPRLLPIGVAEMFAAAALFWVYTAVA